MKIFNKYKLLLILVPIVISVISNKLYSKCDYSQCAPTVQTPDQEYIHRVKFGDIDNTSYTQSKVANYTSLSTDVSIGSNYTIIVTNGNASSLDHVSVFIDWNQDCDFNDSGETYILSTSDNGWTFSGFISVPITASEGTTRMRIRMTFNSTPNPCDFSLYGEVEDYSVNVITTPSISILSINDSLLCIGDSLIISYKTIGIFNSGNVFTAQISDSAGSFNHPTPIGSIASVNSGNISCKIPDSISASNEYLLRIISSNPEIISSYYGPISINSLPLVFNVVGNGLYCSNIKEGAQLELDSSQINFFYQVKKDNINIGNPIVGTGKKLSLGYYKDEGNYTVEAISPSGCINLMNRSIYVKQIPLPIQFLITSGNKSFDKSIDTFYCEEQIGIEIGLSSSQKNIKYILLNGDKEVLTKDGTGSEISFGFITEEGKYTVKARTDSGVCENNMLGKITIKKINVPTKYPIMGDQYFCSGSDGANMGLYSSEIGFKYQLLRNGYPVGNPINGTGKYINFGKQKVVGIYTVEAISLEGNCVYMMNESINLKEVPIPEIEITGNKTPNFGSTENYEDAKANESEKMDWSVEGGEIIGSKAEISIKIKWGNNKNGKVKLTKTNNYGCTLTKEIDINLINNIDADFEVDKTKGKAPLEINFIDKSTGYITDWNWDFGDGESSLQQNPVHIYTVPGIYTVKLSISYKNVSMSKVKENLITVEEKVDIKEAEMKYGRDISLSAIEPNPSNDVIRFTYSISNAQEITIALYNILGERVMLISDGYQIEGLHNKEINISQLPSGAYFLQIIGNMGQINRMINIVK
ncbi:MAG TPA: GEVED domain-containing protein [Bacteroidota bacterium]|nr:GEVED domain-containing protein [Candidatus Kapabacteria bacterium]HRS02191.1 GEVED domain-containing protein [Bacteroidota bacterium]